MWGGDLVTLPIRCRRYNSQHTKNTCTAPKKTKTSIPILIQLPKSKYSTSDKIERQKI